MKEHLKLEQGCIILETAEGINKNLKLEQGWMIQ